MLGRTLDEVSPQTRRMLELIDAMVATILGGWSPLGTLWVLIAGVMGVDPDGD